VDPVFTLVKTCWSLKHGRHSSPSPRRGTLVIPARLRQLLGLKPGDRLALSLERMVCASHCDSTICLESGRCLLPKDSM